MVKVGDQVRLSSVKGPDREGVVTAVAGSMVRVRWPSQQETMLVPAPGTMTVLTAGKAAGARPAAKKAAAKNVATKRPTPKKR